MNWRKTFIFAVFLFFSLTAFAQVNPQLKITQNLKGIRLDQALDTLSQKYKVNFAFDPEQAQLYSVNQSFRNQTIEKVMERLLKNTPFRYEISENVILIVPQPGKAEAPFGAKYSRQDCRRSHWRTVALCTHISDGNYSGRTQ